MPTHQTNDKRDYYRKVYLISDHWKLVRKVMLKLFPCCQICGTKSRLTVHHRKYRNLYDVIRKDLIVLCWPHHESIHRKLPNGKNPKIEDVEKRLLGLLDESPREQYQKVALRFYNASRRIEDAHGCKLREKARRAMWRTRSMMFLRFLRGEPLSRFMVEESPDEVVGKKEDPPKCQILAVKKIKPPPPPPTPPNLEKRARKERLHSGDSSKYISVAKRLFFIAVKINREHGVDFRREARNRLFRYRNHLLKQGRKLISTTGR